MIRALDLKLLSTSTGSKTTGYARPPFLLFNMKANGIDPSYLLDREGQLTFSFPVPVPISDGTKHLEQHDEFREVDGEIFKKTRGQFLSE